MAKEPMLMKIHDRVEDVYGYEAEDVRGLVYNLLEIIDRLKRGSELHPAQDGIISKTREWLK